MTPLDLSYTSSTSTSFTNASSSDVTWSYWTQTAGRNTYSTNSLSTSVTPSTTVWNTWNNTTTTSASNTIVWDQWTTGTATTTGWQDTWQVWTSDSVNQPSNRVVPANVFVPALRRRPSIDVGVARQRADKLLVEHLTPEQEKSLLEDGYFEIDVRADGKVRRFRIYNDKYQHNVFEIDRRGRKLREYCAHTSHACPQSDHALAQKLLLEHNPREFFRVANAWDLRDGLRAPL